MRDNHSKHLSFSLETTLLKSKQRSIEHHSFQKVGRFTTLYCNYDPNGTLH